MTHPRPKFRDVILADKLKTLDVLVAQTLFRARAILLDRRFAH